MTARRLGPEQVRLVCPDDVFEFATTAELGPDVDIIGQERAVRSLEFGLFLSNPGYNIYVSGPSGTGRTTYATQLVRKAAADRQPPSDWCYAFRFDHPNEPIALELTAGSGSRLSQDVAETLAELRSELPRLFEGEHYERQREAILRRAQEFAGEVLSEAETAAAGVGFTIVRGPSGLLPMPAVEGKPMSPEQFGELSEERRQELNRRADEVKDTLQAALRRIRDRERQAKQEIAELDRSIAAGVVDPLVENLISRYAQCDRVTRYLRSWGDDVIASTGRFLPGDDKQANPFLPPEQDFFRRYEVNVVVDNSTTSGSPVVTETNPTYYNLCGKLEYRSVFGGLATDFTMIKGGALARANGGYLVLNAIDVLSQPMAWDGLKRALKNRESRIENLGDPRMELVSGLSPEPIPLDVKVVLIGPPPLYSLLHSLDDDFRKLFKIRADFDVDMPRTPEQVLSYGSFVAAVCNRERLCHFERAAIARLVDHSSRLVGDQEKLSTRFNEILDVVYEASAWAERDGVSLVTPDHVRQAIEQRHYRSSLVQSRMMEMIEKRNLLVDTSGSVGGQVNGLVVYQVGDLAFGRPSRITARAFAGRRGVVDIERESKLGGRIHSKGVLILGGYLGEQYARERPLALAATVCLEQSYGEVEGDSASAAELICLLSAISGVPIRQDLAMTGSVNQRGEIQPIGGVTAKVEGFFDACKLLGFTGTQGVVIPRANERNLMLRDEIAEEIAAGRFHVWSIATVDEGIELLTGVSAGTINGEGNFPRESVHGQVAAQIEKWATTARQDDDRPTPNGGGMTGCPR